MNTFLTVFILILIKITVSHPSPPFISSLPSHSNHEKKFVPILTVNSGHSSGSVWSPEFGSVDTSLYSKIQPSYQPNPPISRSAHPVLVRPSDSSPFYPPLHVPKPQFGEADHNHDDTSFTFLRKHERHGRSLNTNGGDGIHGSNFPEIDSESFGPQSREVILFRVSASGLPNADLFGGEADPFIQISYSNASSSEHFQNFARTATLSNNHEPYWKDIVKFEDYIRGSTQKWKFEIRDHDANDWDDLIGFAFINVDDCVWESRESRILLKESACSAQITNGNGVLSIQIL